MSSDPTYQHTEAYCLMTYTSDDGTEMETVWNSRDGVTPLVIGLRSGKTATHKEWHRDFRVPGYTPPVGSRIFVDLTLEAASRRAFANAEQAFAGVLQEEARSRYGTVAELAAALAASYLSTPGAPDLIEVQP